MPELDTDLYVHRSMIYGGLQCTRDPDSLHMISNLGFTLHNWFDKASSEQFELF